MSGYNNAVVTIAPHGTPDPFVVHHNGKFYLTYTTGNDIQIWESDDIQGFMHTGKKIIVWQPKPGTENAAGIWAPELHAIGGRWWLLYSAEIEGQGNKSHRLYLLAGPPDNMDPCIDRNESNHWQDIGHVQGMLRDQWCIDGTYFILNNALYMVYAGSELGANLDTFNYSNLYIVRMRDPTTVETAPPVKISHPTHGWEWEGNTGVNEGPQWLEAPDGHWKGIVMSVSGTWTQNYKMLLLQYMGGDPLDPRAWRKDDQPFLVSGKGLRGPFAPGHGNSVNIGHETFQFFHATDSPTDGFENRKGRCQRVHWTRDGPTMGGCVGICVGDMQAFNNGPSESDKHKHGAKELMSDLKAGYKKYTSGW